MTRASLRKALQPIHPECRLKTKGTRFAPSHERANAARLATSLVPLHTHRNETCHIWMSPVTYEWVPSHTNESRHIRMSPVTYEWVTSHMNESRHIWMSPVTYEWVTSHMNESRHVRMSHVTYEWVTSHMNESRHIWMSHVMKDVIYECVAYGIKATSHEQANAAQHVLPPQ